MDKKQFQRKSRIIMNELNDKDKEKNGQFVDNDLNNRSLSHSVIRHQSSNDGRTESPILWEKKYISGNSLEDLDNNILPIHVEKQKSCTCNLHQYSTRKLEANSNTNLPLTAIKAKNVQCQCPKCRLNQSHKGNRYSVLEESKLINDMVI